MDAHRHCCLRRNQVKTRHRDVSSSGFYVRLEEEEMDAGHVTEVIGWLAVQPGAGEFFGLQYEAIKTADAVTHLEYSVAFSSGGFDVVPGILGSIASFDGGDPSHLRMEGLPTRTHANIFIEEEVCSDQESEHTTEIVDLLVLSPGTYGGNTNGGGDGRDGDSDAGDCMGPINTADASNDYTILTGLPLRADKAVTFTVQASCVAAIRTCAP